MTKSYPNSSNFAEKLKTDYPNIYKNVYCGIGCPDGWQNIVLEISNLLEPIASKNPHFICVQIKEKFGELRFYVHGIPEPERKIVKDIISRAMKLSSSTCEVCGKLGELRTDLRWQRTLCDEHHDEYKKN